MEIAKEFDDQFFLNHDAYLGSRNCVELDRFLSIARVAPADDALIRRGRKRLNRFWRVRRHVRMFAEGKQWKPRARDSRCMQVNFSILLIIIIMIILIFINLQFISWWTNQDFGQEFEWHVECNGVEDALVRHGRRAAHRGPDNGNVQRSPANRRRRN